MNRRQFLRVSGGAGIAVAFGAAWRAAAALSGGESVFASAGDETASSSSAAGSNPFDDYTYTNDATGTHVRIHADGDLRRFEANGLPNHATGAFPNPHNPNSITAQSYRYSMPASPALTGVSTPNGILSLFGIAINGVLFYPGAAEFWNRDANSGWQYEPLGGAIDLGVDMNRAHVQPSGAYHYHGIPEGMLAGASPDTHSPLMGFAADGFPIYARFSYAVADDPAAGVVALRSSYRVKAGTRPGGPGGTYDGSFVADYEYVAGLGDLDENNGRSGITPEYPGATYYYVLTDTFPFIPRSFAGTPDRGFSRPTLLPGGGGPGGGGRPGGPPPRS